MALGDVNIVSPAGQNFPAAVTFNVAAGGTTINAGEPTKTSTVYAAPSADDEPKTSAPTFIGIASSTSNQTASTVGTVDIIPPLGGVLFSAKAKSAAAVDTAAELAALMNSLVGFDLTSSTYTVDTATSGSTYGLIILGGNITAGTVTFAVRTGATIWA